MLQIKILRTIATKLNSSAISPSFIWATACGKQEGDPQGASKLLGGDTDSGRKTLDMTGQQRGFDGALDCIARAAQLDDANLDTPQLYQIAQQINAKLPGNIQKQMPTANTIRYRFVSKLPIADKRIVLQ